MSPPRRQLWILMWLLTWAATAAAPEEQELAADLRVLPVAPGIWRHVSVREMGEWGPVPANGLIVVGRESAALIDTPWTEEQTGLLLDWVERELGVGVGHVVPTHSHDDCLGGLAEAHRRGATSYALALTREFAEQGGKTVPRETFDHERRISLGGIDLELRHFGAGHTRDNIVVWVPERALLFGGCLIKRTGGSAGYLEEADLAAWPGTLRAVLAAYPDMAIVVPGHGRPGTVEDLHYTVELVEGLDRARAAENEPVGDR